MNKINSTFLTVGLAIGSVVAGDFLTPAQAIIINVGGRNFEIVNLETSFDQDDSFFSNLPWVTDSSLTVEDFAEAAFEAYQNNPPALGLPNNDTLGPLFPEGLILESFPVQIPTVTYNSEGAIVSQTTLGNETATYVVVNEVTTIPEPITFLGSLIAAGFIASSNRKLTQK